VSELAVFGEFNVNNRMENIKLLENAAPAIENVAPHLSKMLRLLDHPWWARDKPEEVQLELQHRHLLMFSIMCTSLYIGKSVPIYRRHLAFICLTVAPLSASSTHVTNGGFACHTTSSGRSIWRSRNRRKRRYVNSVLAPRNWFYHMITLNTKTPRQRNELKALLDLCLSQPPWLASPVDYQTSGASQSAST